ncbi:bifunctional DNA-formamidopyrimidine glycosylase/DNA-(apurinic or apyrimidinic site) lyase [Legionella waltersii]|uniref:Formamidopyrimidine-DNA glycosylase n=1 Tax=Legionella waltersii TaxID=66969 RepID=A0A0W1A388_9GAMM|nr:bifunctional DNA-formamidopyrimidine glycosylase/DNA-(apurinic or apyrimidinic site) lyase [Legionella waltersii]KTD75689.1 formamidopyrimidine-DNA glycosylase [Legionella waltersii]SNU99375.1 formamidopyrimidine-DNA glycosylase [Legionella waltersii]
MPELPEVETTKQGIAPYLIDQRICEVVVRNPRLRIPIPGDFKKMCEGKLITKLSRRAKYILIYLNEGYVLIHLGMSGHLRIVQTNALANKHDHVDFKLNDGTVLRYCDPRRFGMIVYVESDPFNHPLLTHLGPEPLSQDFNSDYLMQKIQKKSKPIKAFIMDSQIVVGVGNIYASESLFLAKIHPATPAKNLNQEMADLLVSQIKTVLEQAIQRGGTTLRDFYGSDGKPGYFYLSLNVYGRKNKSCYQCNTPIDSITIGGRQSAFCPSCQVLTNK